MIDVPVLYLPLFFVSILALVRRWKRSTLPYPPGPKGYPILGNVLDLPMSVPIWENITSLSNRHGTDILYLQVLGQDMVVLSSSEAITDLTEKRSGIYSDRPQTTMLELSGGAEWAFAAMPYGAPWKARRKLCHEVLNVRLTETFDDYQYKYVHHLLSRLLEKPESFIQELDFTPGAIVLSITYGIDVKSADGQFLTSIAGAAHILATATTPGKFLVDAIPILQYVPDWFPGAGFKAIAKEAREKGKVSISGPLEYVKNAMKSGEGISQSITSDCLSRLEGGESAFDEEVVRDVSSMMFSAAAETTRSALRSFFLAMVLNPQVMKKAQEELDRTVSKGQLPGFSDKDNLPYIDALVKETLRWSPPLPVGGPRRAMQDDVYRGYFIPAGAIVVPNVWAICRDPNLYSNPETFNPERFLKGGKINPLMFDPEERVFGSGRRICPGRYLALRTIYLVVVCVLSVFDIGPVLDEDGNPQLPNPQYIAILVRCPKPFECTIKPRSEAAVKLVKETCDRAKWV